jgi:hypothetical protein
MIELNIVVILVFQQSMIYSESDLSNHSVSDLSYHSLSDLSYHSIPYPAAFHIIPYPTDEAK